ncbi:hypothetical protein V6N13_064321 [Hibiscus sabdariffa]
MVSLTANQSVAVLLGYLFMALRGMLFRSGWTALLHHRIGFPGFDMLGNALLVRLSLNYKWLEGPFAKSDRVAFLNAKRSTRPLLTRKSLIGPSNLELTSLFKVIGTPPTFMLGRWDTEQRTRYVAIMMMQLVLGQISLRRLRGW